MPDFTIYIGNKNYSSWSLRGWLMLKQTGVAFTEEMIPLDQAATQPSILRRSPSGKVPALRHGELVVWESLAIGEYHAERFPAARLWPEAPAARAIARAASAEMHAGFAALRSHLPMNMRASVPDRGLTPAVEADIERIAALWRDCRQRFGAGGPFLFGSFTIADAMFAPVVSRFLTYKVALEVEAQRYCDAVWALPALREWVEAARNEPMVIERLEF
jgi:glutathione S-transferase